MIQLLHIFNIYWAILLSKLAIENFVKGPMGLKHNHRWEQEGK